MRKMLLASFVLWLCTSLGCMSFANFLVYVVKGLPKFPAEYEGLEGKRVAVVCVSTTNAYGPSATTSRVAREMRSLLAANVTDIDMVSDEEVSDWMDHHDATQIDYSEIGRGVKADMVVSVELNQPISLREGPTLYQGKADFTVTVFDIGADGKKVFRRREEEFQWPAQARYGVSETKFERAFHMRVASRAARYFHPFEEHSDIGENTSDVGDF